MSSSNGNIRHTRGSLGSNAPQRPIYDAKVGHSILLIAG
jgi:hypothetical protein